VAPPGCVVFDLGGVLIELDTDRLLQRLGCTGRRADWHAWMLHSAAAQDFECGRVQGGTFARRAIAELGLDISVEAFGAAFSEWVRGPFASSRSLVGAVTVDAVCLSNCNALHWDRLKGQGVHRWFSRCFMSHELGAAKPMDAAFAAVEREVDGPLLFLDDNEVNVHAARARGWDAERVDGPEAAHTVLAVRGLLRR